MFSSVLCHNLVIIFYERLISVDVVDIHVYKLGLSQHPLNAVNFFNARLALGIFLKKETRIV